MVKRLFFLLIIISILSLTHQNCPQSLTNYSLTNCQTDNKSCCYLEGAQPACVEANTTSYEEMKKSLSGMTSISQLHCGTKYEKCINQSPDEGIEKTCTDLTKDDDSYKCCYMKISYDKNKKYSCYPVMKKNKDEIKKLIEELKNEYTGSKKISIDCSSQNIVLSFFVLFFAIFWL